MDKGRETESEKNKQDFQLYLRLVTLLHDYGGATLRTIFRRRYENLTKQKWEDGSQASKDFPETIGISGFKSCKPIQQIMLQKGDLDEWDLVLLSIVLQNINFTNCSAEEKVQYKNENKAIKELIKVRNNIEHLSGKSISVCDFNIFWKRVADNLIKLHVSPAEIDSIRSCANIHGIEFQPTNKNHVNADNYLRAKALKDEGNAATRSNELNKAIQLYTKALNLYGVPQVERGIIYSNRSSVYLKLLEENATSSEDEVEQNYKLAKEDAEKVIELRPTWWKGYYRLGRVLQFKKDWKSAIVALDQALVLNMGDKEILNARDTCRFKGKSEKIKEHIQPLILQNELDLDEVWGKFAKERGMCGRNDVKTVFKNMQVCVDSSNPELRSLGFVFFAHRHAQGVDGYKKNYEKAAELFSKAAKIGNAEALYNVGLLHQKGMGVLTDFELAAEYFEKAAKCPMNGFKGFNKLGVVGAQYALGRCYDDGVGKPQDFFEAARWYSLASQNGCGQASNNLALLYDDGFGVEKSQQKAIQYRKLAVSQGEIVAMENLAWQYLDDGNLEEAEKWFLQSISAGNLNSTLNQKRFQERLRQKRFMLERREAIRGMPVPLQIMVFGEYNGDNASGESQLLNPNNLENVVLNCKRSREESLSQVQQTNPMRIHVVLKYRENFKHVLTRDRKGGKFSTSTSKPINEQKLPSLLTGLQGITLDEMNRTTDHVYSSKVLHATIMEDCILNILPSIHTVIRDDNGDFILCYFYNFNQKDVETRQKFSFGSRISILNPYHRLTADRGFGIRIDDPQSVVFNSAGDDAPICRFCCKPDPSEHCSKCKRAKYCSRNCQVQDWNMLKHRLICRPLMT